MTRTRWQTHATGSEVEASSSTSRNWRTVLLLSQCASNRAQCGQPLYVYDAISERQSMRTIVVHTFALWCHDVGCLLFAELWTQSVTRFLSERRRLTHSSRKNDQVVFQCRSNVVLCCAEICEEKNGNRTRRHTAWSGVGYFGSGWATSVGGKGLGTAAVGYFGWVTSRLLSS